MNVSVETISKSVKIRVVIPHIVTERFSHTTWGMDATFRICFTTQKLLCEDDDDLDHELCAEFL